MKKALWLILVTCMLLLAGCGESAPAKTEPAGVQEIHTAQQLQNMASNGDYILMEDLDLAGFSWKPLDFAGHLDGNGKTIANLALVCSAKGNMGLFGTLTGTVENLHLERATLTTDSETQNAGFFAGTNQGLIQNCTVTGDISDGQNTCLGIMTGWNAGGQVLGGSSGLTATAGSPNPADQVTGLSACVSLNLVEERIVGIAGNGDSRNVDQTILWQDTSYRFEDLPEWQQQRRQGVVDAMYQMGTVRWTPSEEISYTANDNRKSTHSNVYLPGRTYVGVPYNGCESSFDRFLTQMQPEIDNEGRLVTVWGLENGIKNKDGSVSGFILNMGNDCVGAVIWALASGLPYSVEDQGMEFGKPLHMVPNEYNIETYGALPIDGYRIIVSNKEKYPDGLDARDTKTIIDLNGGPEGMAEYYSKAHRGDYLICVRYSYDAATDTWKKTANHGRVLAYEPMIVRRWDGVIDLEESYAITHEQGDGLYDNRLENGEYETYQGYNLKQTSWRTDYRYSLSLLLTEQGYASAYLPGTGYGYIPVTVGAYSTEDLAEFACRQVSELTLPNQGTYKANYLLTRATMTITDDQGSIVYEKTAYLPYRTFEEFSCLKLEDLFPDATDGLQGDETYYETLQVYGTGERNCILLEKEAFTK